MVTVIVIVALVLIFAFAKSVVRRTGSTDGPEATGKMVALILEAVGEMVALIITALRGG